MVKEEVESEGGKMGEFCVYNIVSNWLSAWCLNEKVKGVGGTQPERKKIPRPMIIFHQSLNSSKKWHKCCKRKGETVDFTDVIKYVQVPSNYLRTVILGDRLLSLWGMFTSLIINWHSNSSQTCLYQFIPPSSTFDTVSLVFHSKKGDKSAHD